MIDLWRAEARRIGKEEDHSQEVVLSLFDRTGNWSKPYREAGYDVRQYDIALGDDLLRFLPVADIEAIKDSGKSILGVLAAPPCTSFAVSGARWWKDEHDVQSPQMVAKKYGEWASVYFDSPLEYAKTLVHAVEVIIELAQPEFYAIENPVGRLAKVMGFPHPLLSFDPCDYGDPYTKRTHLWGRFNPELPFNRVYPSLGSLIHRLRGDHARDKARRSATPLGFSYAFFMANHGAPAGAVQMTLLDGVFREATA